VWVAIDPVTKLLLTIDVGKRTLAMAQCVVHQVVALLAPDCVPLFLADGNPDYVTAILTHFGQWVQPPRRRANGPIPKPRWMPLPGLLYAQVVKTVRRRRLVRVRHRVVFGTLEAIQQVLAACGWQINTAFVERINLTLRQHVAAVGRRVSTLCKGEDGLRQQLALYHTYYNFCLLLLTAYLLTPTIAPTRSDERHRQTLAAADTRDGGGADRSRVDLERGTAVPRAAVATARGGVSQPWWWEAARGGGLSRRRASTRPASRTSTEGRGPLGCRESPLV
jgi:hypothetical protein